MTSYNLSRSVQNLLDEHQFSPASFTVKLYPDYWTLNNGSKCLYTHQIASLLDDIRAQRIPVDFLELFDTAKLPFYDELQDFRPQRVTDPLLEEPQRSRVVLTPNPESLWADICLLNQKAGNTWTDHEALEVEARILLATSPPLCLDPDPHLVRVANNVLRASGPTTPLPLKRKAAVMEQEDDETEKARRAKLAQFMNPKFTRPAYLASQISFRLWDAAARFRISKSQSNAPTTSQATQAALPYTGVAPPGTQAAMPYPPSVAPVPVIIPTAIAVPQAPATPVPPAALTQASQEPSKANAKHDVIRSPSVARASATPAQSTVPLPIPPHLQPHYPQQANLQAAPRPSQSPHTPPNTAAANSPSNAGTRPSSAAPHPAQPSHGQHQPVQGQAPVATTQPVHTAGTFQPPVTAVNFASQAAAGKKRTQPNVTANGTPASNYPQAGQTAQHPTQPPAMPYSMYYQMQAYQNAAAQQRMNQAPGPSASPVAGNSTAAGQANAPARNSPMPANQRLTTQSPMPPNAQQQAAHGPQQTNYNYAALQNQYNAAAAAAAHLRPVAHGHPSHPQMLPQQMAGGAQAAASTGAQQQHGVPHDQAQAAQILAQYPHMYMNHAHVGVNMQPGRVLAGYWPGIGRGAPIPNAQHQMPAMTNHPQQMPLGANKAAQGGS
ncbi:uncharacterized protein FIBRA_04683 [Fibroporia radiculosa]|uniref:Spt20-like SEP domain-containing protein n=1 Tax=Fibroporia radiculosa TaxID=599839 RepID=J4GPN0_9APHY|nr:uncharacterized protein FIBRA_04683 [Fibroporia radiculosa]CCM02580.1 predicted protein [Fibroporia radiculosa]